MRSTLLTACFYLNLSRNKIKQSFLHSSCCLSFVALFTLIQSLPDSQLARMLGFSLLILWACCWLYYRVLVVVSPNFKMSGWLSDWMVKLVREVRSVILLKMESYYLGISREIQKIFWDLFVLFYVDECVCLRVCLCTMFSVVRRGHWIPWSYKWLWATIWVWGSIPGPLEEKQVL